MSRRFCLYAVGGLFAAAVALAVAGLWVPASLGVSGCMYFAGRSHAARELDMVKARERRLDDELNNRHRRVHNGAGHVSPAALLDHNRNTTADATGGARAQVRSARH